MAKEPSPTTVDEEEWEEVKVGLGEEWNFDQKGDLIGVIYGAKEIELPEKSWTTQQDGTTRKTAGVWEFILENGEMVFVWDSYQLTEALTEAGVGDKVKIHYDGYRDFDNGSRRVKQYKVFLKKK